MAVLYWVRELSGWVLLFMGLAGFTFAGILLINHRAIEASTLTFASFFVFRGGLHLLKVAVAARICHEAAQLGQEQSTPRPLRQTRTVTPRAGRPSTQPVTRRPERGRMPAGPR